MTGAFDTAAPVTDASDNAALDTVARLRILPVVVIDDPAGAHELGDALVAGGLPLAEITLRTPGALVAAKVLAARSGMTVGVGSVVRAAQVTEAAESGAAFVVTPGLSRAVLDECRTCGIPVVPGIATPTELIAAMDAGVSTVKFFPAEQAGGVAALQAFAGPFPDARFVPTGGLTAANHLDYLRLPSVLAVGGSWMVPRQAIADGDFGMITSLAAQSVQGARR